MIKLSHNFKAAFYTNASTRNCEHWKKKKHSIEVPSKETQDNKEESNDNFRIKKYN